MTTNGKKKIYNYSIDHLLSVLEGEPYTNARTYIKDPHEYIVRKEFCQRHPINGDDLFTAMAAMIQQMGSLEYWKYGKSYTYLYSGGHKYWIMDPTPEQTTIINRAKA